MNPVPHPKRKIRRGRGKGKQKSKGIKVMFNNINGFTSKKDSLEKIVASIDPDIIALCETKKGLRLKKDELKGYNVIESNVKHGKEGILVGVREGTFEAVREVTESPLKNIMTVQIVYPTVKIRLIVAHAPQESCNGEKRVEFFEELAVQIERSTTSGDVTLILGDFNARIFAENDKVFPNPESPNGKLFSQVINEYSLKVGNFHPNALGKWTRIQSSNKGEAHKSQIDYVLADDNIYQSINSLMIDEEKIYCPFRVTTVKGKKKITYSDHCVITIDLSLETGKVKRKENRGTCWHFNEEGYEKYRTESKISIEVDTSGSASDAYVKWVTEFEKLLGRCFSRKSIKVNADSPAPISQNYKKVREILVEFGRKGKIQRSIARTYQQKMVEIECRSIAETRSTRLRRAMSQLTEADKFSPSGFWKMKKAADKNTRKEESNSTIVKDNGVEVSGSAAVKEAYKEEFQTRLSNRDPAEGWEEYVEETNETVRQWLSGESSSTPLFTLKELKKVIAAVKNNTPGVDGYPAKLFKDAGDGVLKSILTVINMIKAKNEIPQLWNLVRIATIYKQKGSKKKLKYYRGIFLSIVISKIFENLVKNRIEEKIKHMNLLQAGSRTNRGAADNVFLLRACIDHHKFTGKKLFVTTYDFEQAFDGLWLEDCILSLKDLGVEKEYLQLIYNLNKTATIIVQTPKGETSSFVSDPIVKQGTVLGPVLCSSSTAEYCDENVGVNIGTVIIPSLAYVDDLLDMTCTIDDLISAHGNALLFEKRKKLRYSSTKCFCMAINQKSGDTLPTLMIDIGRDSKVIPTSQTIYLGDVFNSKGNNDGLILDRVNRGTKAMITILSLMAETDVGVYRVCILLLLYRVLFLSTMLFNSETWSKIRCEDIQKLSTVQLKFLKRVVGVSSSTSNSFTYLELGVLPIKHEKTTYVPS